MSQIMLCLELHMSHQEENIQEVEGRWCMMALGISAQARYEDLSLLAIIGKQV